MLDRKKAGMFSVLALSTAIITGITVNAFADDGAVLTGSKQAEKTSQTSSDVPAMKTPSHAQLVDRLTQELNLNDKTRDKVSDLFEKDGEEIRDIQEQLYNTQMKLSSLSPSSKDYLKKVNVLARKSGDLTTDLTIAYAENRAELYGLLTPAQISQLEVVDKPQQ